MPVEMQLQEFSQAELEDFVVQLTREIAAAVAAETPVLEQQGIIALRQACYDEIAYLKRQLTRRQRTRAS